MQVSIIICTCNRAESLKETLCSLAAVDASPGSELIVVNNGSDDETRCVVERCGLRNMTVRYIYEPERGQSNARNAGLAAAFGEIIVFTDDDLRFPRRWLKEITRPILEGKADAVSGGIKLASSLARDWMTPMHRAWLADTTHDNPYLRGCLVGANMAFRKDVLHKVPYFDPELGPGALGFADDVLFSRQLSQAGYCIVYARDTVVEHHCQEDRLRRSSFAATAAKHGRTSAYMMHHWEHQFIKWPHLQIIRKVIQLALWRWTHPRCYNQTEGIHIAEMHHLRSLYLYRQYLVQRKRPTRYEWHGLVLKGASKPKVHSASVKENAHPVSESLSLPSLT